MALQKQNLAINFAKGINTKSDPYQLAFDRFIALNNAVFGVEKRLTKRNGFGNLTELPDANQTTITTLNNNLLATGVNLYAYSNATDEWLDKGLIQPVSLDTKSIIRSSNGQTNVDAAITNNGLACVVYIESSLAYYQIVDSSTGQQIVSRTALPSTAVDPRVFVLGRYFIITFKATVSASPHLQYISIPIAMPSSPASAIDISSSVGNLTTSGYDGVVTNNNLYLSWEGSGNTVKIAYLTSTLVVSSTTTISSHNANLMSVTADETGSTSVIWITFWDTTSDDGYTTAVDHILAEILAPTQIITNTEINAITSSASNSILTVFYENANTYSYSSVKTDYISKITVDEDGTVGSPSIILRSVGLASKSFIGSDNTIYMTCTYGEANQPTYFLIDSTGAIYMRLAYSNGGGYITNEVLPSVTTIGTEYVVPYLFKSFLAPVNKGTNLPDGTPSNGIYTQTGVNLARFTINDSPQFSSEIASTLHLTGGQLWMYDGVKPVEHGFHVWPENIGIEGAASDGVMSEQIYYYVFTYEWTDNAGNLHRSAPSIPLIFEIVEPPATFDGNRTSGSDVLTTVSTFAGLQIGQKITGTGIPANTYIIALDENLATVTMSNNATSGTDTTTTITPTATSAVTINVPTLRLTYKTTPNPVRIVGYRWSEAQQTYYQFTSITSPNLNDPTVDSITITDDNSDAEILGQTLLYTTGGVVENIAPPACKSSALFKNRQWLIDAENPNSLWYSKEVVQNTPVEFSDLFTKYVAPTTGAQGSTGDAKVISAMDDKLIIFKSDAIYYITGNGPDNTGANNDFSEPIFITSSVGCDDPQSVVVMPLGIMFRSNKGIWLLGRDLSTKYIGADVQAYNAFDIQSALSIPETNQVRFILENGIMLMYDYYYDQWGTFSTLSAISATLHNGLHTYLNSFGQVFQETPGSYLDGTSPVLMSFTTAWINLAGVQGYERFYFMHILGTYYTPFKLAVQFAYDYNPSPSQSVTITPTNTIDYYGDQSVYGGGGPYGGEGDVFEARVFPEVQKCESFQLTVNELFDATQGIPPGQGLSLSELNLTVGMKKGYRTQSARKSYG